THNLPMTTRGNNRTNKNDEHIPKISDVSIVTGALGTRLESDSLGTIEVPAEHYWGAQTQRSLIHFSIGEDHMPKAVYHAYGYVKKAAALVNAAAGRLEKWRADAIIRAADEAIAGQLDDNFPLYVWQTGSGTQSNMNVNEVLSNRATQLRDAIERVRGSEVGLFELAAGGTAVGTGLNAPPDFSKEIAAKIGELTGGPFVTAPNKFAAQGSLDAMVAAMSALRGLAVA